MTFSCHGLCGFLGRPRTGNDAVVHWHWKGKWSDLMKGRVAHVSQPECDGFPLLPRCRNFGGMASNEINYIPSCKRSFYEGFLPLSKDDDPGIVLTWFQIRWLQTDWNGLWKMTKQSTCCSHHAILAMSCFIWDIKRLRNDDNRDDLTSSRKKQWNSTMAQCKNSICSACSSFCTVVICDTSIKPKTNGFLARTHSRESKTQESQKPLLRNNEWPTCMRWREWIFDIMRPTIKELHQKRWVELLAVVPGEKTKVPTTSEPTKKPQTQITGSNRVLQFGRREHTSNQMVKVSIYANLDGTRLT